MGFFVSRRRRTFVSDHKLHLIQYCNIINKILLIFTCLKIVEIIIPRSLSAAYTEFFFVHIDNKELYAEILLHAILYQM